MNTARESRHLRWPSLALAMFALSATVAASPGAAAPRGRPLLAYWAFNCFTTCGDANFTPEAVSLSPAP